jgi:predicted enzyme related to lactoylglutathione lyase
MTGEVVHFEIPSDDIGRARKFYERTFGWKLNPMGGLEYTLASTGPSGADGAPAKPGHIDGGILRRQAPVKHPTITIRVDDIDVAAKAIEKNGGKVIDPKSPIGDGSIGYAAYFEDTEGNVIGLFQRAGT